MMTLHLPGLPHTVTTEAYSHCAFTAKVLKFTTMMGPLPGYRVVHYGVEGADTDADEQVTIMSREEQDRLRGHDGSDASKFVGDDSDLKSELYRTFNARLRRELTAAVDPDRDLVLLPFGWGHAEAVEGLPSILVESGIGYPDVYPPCKYRVFESYAWLHHHQGRERRSGKHYEWVVPNYFDVDAWDACPAPDMNTVVFLGRVGEVKGLHTIVEIARHRQDLRFLICGQGDPAPWLTTPNIEYRPPLVGRERSAYLGNARCVLMPTVFTEPFGGVAVEAMLCGTPVLTTTYGAFTETIEDEVTGFRCHTLGDFLAALDRAPDLDRRYIRDRARQLYGYERVGRMYDRVFQQIGDLWGEGWYAQRSVLGPVRVEMPDRWEAAQEAEREYHMNADFRAPERRKREHYRSMIGITEEGTRGLSVIDVGGGPESLLLDYPEIDGTVLDPLSFGEEDERRYAEASIKRLILPVEQWESNGRPERYDEVWVYNCLQHVRDLDEAFRRIRNMGKTVRLWEWCEIPTDSMHLHVLTADRIRRAMQGWKIVDEMEGKWTIGSRPPDKFYAGVFARGS